MSSVVAEGCSSTGFAGPEFPDDSFGLWYLLRCLSRQEKALAADLQQGGAGCFLPLLRSIRYHGNRKAVVHLPMFPGYVFMRGSIERVSDGNCARRIASIIKVVDQKRLDTELRNIHMACFQRAPLRPYPYLREGVRVEVRTGPFRGMRGMIESLGARERLILQVNMLGRAVSVELDGALLDPV